MIDLHAPNPIQHAPHSEDMERGLLCSMMLSKEVLEECSALIARNAFFIPANGLIFDALRSWNDGELPRDYHGFKEQLRQDKQLEEIGGVEYLSNLWGFVPTSANWRFYADTVLDYYRRRVVINECNALRDKMYSPEEAEESVQGAAESVFTKLSTHLNPRQKPFKTLVLETLDLLEERSKQIEKSGVLFGIPELDNVIGGLHPGELWVIAAQTSGGKSALAMQSALHSAINRKIASAIFSLEMDAHELIERMLAHTGLVSMRSLRRGTFTERECAQLNRGVEALCPLKLYIEDDYSLGTTAIISRCRQLKVKHDIGLVIIDYFQLLEGVSNQYEERREREVSKVVRASKMLARELSIPVIGISQLNDDGRLRESRAIGHHADGVLTLDPPESEEEDMVDITVVKMRNGPRGKKIPVQFLGEFMQFRQSTTAERLDARKGNP